MNRLSKEGMVQELAMEITARVMYLEENILHPKEQVVHYEAIKTASNTICSLTSGLRTPKSPVNARLAVVMGAFLLALCIPAHATEGFATYYTSASTKAEGTSGVFTANGEHYDEQAMTCALRSRRFGQKVVVYGHNTGKSVILRQNDFGPGRGPTKRGVVIDLTPKAFKEVCGDLSAGRCAVSVQEVV